MVKASRSFETILALILAILCMAAVHARAEDLPDHYAFHDDTPMVLGHGFYPSKLSKATERDCVVYDKLIVETGGWGNVELHTSVVYDYQSFLDSQNFSLEAHAQTPTTSFDAKYSDARSLVSNSKNVSIVVSVSQSAPRRYIDGARLSKEMQDALVGDHPGNVFDACGTRYAKVEHRGASFSALITIVEASQNLRNKVAASAGARYGASGFSADAKAAFDREVTEAKEHNRFEVRVYANGGRGAQDLADLVAATVKKQPAIDDIGVALGNYLRNLDQSQAVITGYDVADMPGIAEALKDPWTVEKLHLLLDIQKVFWKLNDRRDILSAIVERNDPRFEDLSDVALKPWSDKLAVVKEGLSEIAANHQACLKQRPPILDLCRTPHPHADTALALEVPDPIEPPRGRFGIAVFDGSAWQLLSHVDSDDVLASSIAKDEPADRDIDHAQSYGARFFQRLTAYQSNAVNGALGFMVATPRLSDIEVFSTLKEGYEPRAKDTQKKLDPDARHRSLYAAAGVSLATSQYTPPHSDAADIGNAKYRHWVVLTLAGSKPTQGMAPAMDIYNELPNLARYWIATSDSSKGEFSINLSARDSFGGRAEFILLNASYEVDSKLAIARVKYVTSTGEPGDTVYLGGVGGDASKNLPDIRIHATPRLRVDNATSYRVTNDVKDQWGDLALKLCYSKGKIVSPSPPIRTLTISQKRTPDYIEYLVSNPTSSGGGFHVHVEVDYSLDIDSTYRVHTAKSGPLDKWRSSVDDCTQP